MLWVALICLAFIAFVAILDVAISQPSLTRETPTSRLQDRLVRQHRLFLGELIHINQQKPEQAVEAVMKFYELRQDQSRRLARGIGAIGAVAVASLLTASFAETKETTGGNGDSTTVTSKELPELPEAVLVLVLVAGIVAASAWFNGLRLQRKMVSDINEMV